MLPISVPEIQKVVFSLIPHISWYLRMELLFSLSAPALIDLVPKPPPMATRPRSLEMLPSAASTLLIAAELSGLTEFQEKEHDSLRALVRCGLQENCSKLCTGCISHWKCSVCSPAAPVTLSPLHPSRRPQLPPGQESSLHPGCRQSQMLLLFTHFSLTWCSKNDIFSRNKV